MHGKASCSVQLGYERSRCGPTDRIKLWYTYKILFLLSLLESELLDQTVVLLIGSSSCLSSHLVLRFANVVIIVVVPVEPVWLVAGLTFLIFVSMLMATLEHAALLNATFI